jgi:hypothetical protein
MKKLFPILVLATFLGCSAPSAVQQLPTETHQVVTGHQVPVELTATIPSHEYTGSAVANDGSPTEQVWDWPDATTVLTVTPEQVGEGPDGQPLPPRSRYDVRTSIKAQSITLRDTVPFLDTLELMVVRYAGADSVFRVTETDKEFLYTVTNDYQPCTTGTPMPPGPGSPWWKWALWALALASLLIGVGRASRPGTTPKLSA